MNKKTFSFLIAFLTLFFAQAHVAVVPAIVAAGDYTKLTFRVPHGCEGSATTSLTVTLPPGVLSVKPQAHPGWKISMKKIKLTTPVELHGKPVTESISEVTWSGGPLSDEYMDEFGISLKMPPEPQESLAFPVLQKCKKGTANWNEVVSPEHAHHAKFPAPEVKLESGSIKK